MASEKAPATTGPSVEEITNATVAKAKVRLRERLAAALTDYRKLVAIVVEGGTLTDGQGDLLVDLLATLQIKPEDFTNDVGVIKHINHNEKKYLTDCEAKDAADHKTMERTTKEIKALEDKLKAVRAEWSRAHFSVNHRPAIRREMAKQRTMNPRVFADPMEYGEALTTKAKFVSTLNRWQ